MAEPKVGSKALVASASSSEEVVVAKKQRLVLDEDAYTEKIEKIIVRDFFPDLPKLQAQAEYVKALDNNDTAKLRELSIKFGSKRTNTPGAKYCTPSTFETPSDIRKPTPSQTSTQKSDGQSLSSEDKLDNENPAVNPEAQPENDDSDLTLDKFLNKVTSEDNESFKQIMIDAEEKHRIKNAWLYDKVGQEKEAQAKQLVLPSCEEQAAITSNTEAGVVGWTYTPRNEVMYIPEGKELSVKEKIELAKNPRGIEHENTRFKTNPFSVAQSKAQLQEAASAQAQINSGKVGIDGKESVPTVTPRVNGYGFVATPSPAPGVDESPLMTWGEIDGTPFRLDGGATPRINTPGPTFKIPEVPTRDRIALDLAEKASKQHRAKKKKALDHVARLKSPAPRFGSVRHSDRISSMSPAAQRMLSTKLGVRAHTDKSYTPSPAHARLGKTPDSRRQTRTPLVRTPVTRSDATPSASQKEAPGGAASLTDNLLNLPKRAQAEDFF